MRFVRRPCRRAFSLIELLMVIGIIAVLVAVLMPALQGARREGMRTACLSNLRETGIAQLSYLDENDNLPWTCVYQLDASGDPVPYPGGSGNYSSYTWGGMKAPRPDPGDEQVDWAVLPAEIRPFNRILDPAARGSDPIKVLQCPADKSAFSPYVGQAQVPLELEENKSAWQAFGNSYSINWHFMFDPEWNEPFSFHNLMSQGRRVVKQGKSGPPAEFVTFFGNQADQLFVEATATGGGRLGVGWHGKLSFHEFLFLDGHGDYRLFDTRFTGGPGWTVWPKVRPQ